MTKKQAEILLADTKMIPVTSSNIQAIGYHSPQNTLLVTFKSGATYAYVPISPECFGELMTAESQGKYLNEKVKTNESVEAWKLKG